MPSSQTFQSTHAIQMLRRLSVHVHNNNGATIGQLMKVSGLSETQTNLYVKYMVANGEIHCSRPHVRTKNGGIAAFYSPGSEEDESTSDSQQTIRRPKKWPPNHVRDILHCYLFGTPEVLKAKIEVA